MKIKPVHILCLIIPFFSCTRTTIILENDFYRLILNEKTGSIQRFEKKTKDHSSVLLTDSAACAGPLFSLRMLDPADSGHIYKTDASKAQKISVRQSKDTTYIDYDRFSNLNIAATVRITHSSDSPHIHWHISVKNRTTYALDWIDFPNICVPNDLIATGGTGRIFWPGMEGCLIEDMRIRDESPWTQYAPIEYPHMGWRGLYPSSVQMQFMAYYNENGGLYLAAHDSLCRPKGIEYRHSEPDGIKLEFRIFAEGTSQEIYSAPYELIMAPFEGDWYDAADIYRQWKESSAMRMPPKITDNKALPKWYFQSPVVVTYPVRGHKDLGDMTPNELFPYMNGLKYIEKYAQKFQSPIMALLMHWEGSAPWAPPYVWPPYGGEEMYHKFVQAIHAGGNLVGLYASGIGYTLRSNTDTTYSRQEEFNQFGLSRVMKVAPSGALATNGVCAGESAQRIGYDMCPANSFVKRVVAEQVSQILKSKTDYIQYFDQNLGGSCYPCYGTVHGHAYGGGIWQNKAMHAIFDTLRMMTDKYDNHPLIGCEAAAAEPHIPYLFFNDARAMINLFMGTPVPAYAYVYHEYVNNFMGNQNAVSVAIDMEKSPLNYLQRLAYAFCAGDMLTIILRGDGNMIWDWGTLWEAPLPDQQQITSLIHNLNSWRRGTGRDFLLYGRMIKPLKVSGTSNVPMITKPGGRAINFPSVMTSAWVLPDGRKAQFLVNYKPIDQTITISGFKNNVHIIADPHDEINDAHIVTDGTIQIPPLSAVMVIL